MAAEKRETLESYRQHLKEKLDSCFTRNEDPHKRFAPRGRTRVIFEQSRLEKLLRLLYTDSKDPPHHVDHVKFRSIAEKIRGSEDSGFCCNVLAVLIYLQCQRQTLMDFVEGLRNEKWSCPYSDDDLPLTKDDACQAFGHDDGLKFWKDQYQFCPVILKEQDEVVYESHNRSCPRPFLEEPEKIGRGAYAVVYKVTIEKGHLTNDQGSNDRHEYAMKEFIGYDAEARKSFDAEGATIKQFIQSIKSHDNIVTTKASLEWGNTYSLFFDLAKCNLWQSFMGDQDPVTTLEQKQKVFSRTIGLAGALAYLHDEVYLASTNENLRCYHLDLKPQNILVFEAKGDIIWKISDFGISRIKHVAPNKHQTESKHHKFLDKVFSKQPDEDPSSGVDNSRYGGTYAAPEAKEKSDTVTTKSDVWSLACVITLVLTYLHDQSQAIRQFQKSRERERSHDWFFDSQALKAGSENTEILHSSVLNWLDTLNDAANGRDNSEAEVTKRITDLLRHKIFLRDEKERWSANEVKEELRSIQILFTESNAKPPISPTPRTSHRRLPPIPWPRFSNGNPKNPNPQRSWRFKTSEAYSKSRFSTNGKYLGVSNDNVMEIKPIASIQQGQAGTRFASPKDRRWADFSMGSKYLCAALDSDYFEFTYLPLSTEEDIDRFDGDTELKCRIQRVAMSPDDQITAFVLEDSRHGSHALEIAIYRTEDLLGGSRSSQATVQIDGNSGPSEFPTAASTLDDLPWGNIMRGSQDLKLPVGAQKADLKFSNNSHVLMGITHAFNQQGSQGWQYKVFAWDIDNGRSFKPIRSHTTGFDNMGDTWVTDSFAVFATQGSFAAMSKSMIRWGSYDPSEYKTQSKILADELLDILATDREEEVVLVGRSAGKGDVRAFRVSTSKIKGLESLGRGFKIGSKQYNRVTDCCCLLEREDKLVIMVANLDRDEVRLYETILE